MDQCTEFMGGAERANPVSRHTGPADDFPAAMVARLRRSGVMTAPLPRSEGGLGWGTEEAGMLPLGDALQAIGYGSLAAGRIYEAHVNAIVLIFRYGDARIRSFAAAAVR